MVLKLLASLALIGSSTAAGFLIAGSFAARPEQIRSFQAALEMLETEIGYTRTPLVEALERVGAIAVAPAGPTLRRAAALLRQNPGREPGDAWREAVGWIYPETALSPTDRQVLEQMSPYLGASDRDDQLRHLRVTMTRLKQLEEEARGEAQRNQRMWQYLGVLTGTAIVLILL